MKITYFLKNTPIELNEIPALLTQNTMKATGSAIADRLCARLSEEELRDVTVCVRLKKAFLRRRRGNYHDRWTGGGIAEDCGGRRAVPLITRSTDA